MLHCLVANFGALIEEAVVEVGGSDLAYVEVELGISDSFRIVEDSEKKDPSFGPSDFFVFCVLEEILRFRARMRARLT